MGLVRATSFIGLSDTVGSLGTEGQVPVVSGATLAFSGITAGATSFVGLRDTVGSLGAEGQVPVGSGDTLAFSPE